MNEEAVLEKPEHSDPDIFEEIKRCVSAETVLRRNEPLARRTTLRVGGPADVYAEPASEADLASLAGGCAKRHVPLFVLGRGSNLLVREGGFRGVVLCLVHPAFCGIDVNGETLRCGAGARLKAVAVEAKRHGVGGLEFLEGIPGTVGGALRMNAGAMGGAIFQLVESVRVMDCRGVVEERAAGSLHAQYRSCESLRGSVALRATLRGSPAHSDQIERLMRQLSERRWATQPAAPSAGCMFKNPPGIPAGKLIDELGLKGTRVGGAVVSAEHGNFIVTDGTATARDVADLIELIKTRVKEARGIDLETEVEIIGEW